MASLTWKLKQLTPRTYWTTYAPDKDGQPSPEHFVIWKMWLGHCYDVIDIECGAMSAPFGRASSPPLPT